MDAIFLQINGGKEIKGDSTVEGFKDWIEILSFSHGVAAQLTGDVSNQNRTSGRPIHQDLSVTKYVDNATPKISEYCCKGTVFPEAKLVIARNVKDKLEHFMDYTLKDVVIGSSSVGGGGGGKPVETLTLNYAEIAWQYYLEDDAGKVKKAASGKWDLSKNTAK